MHSRPVLPTTKLLLSLSSSNILTAAVKPALLLNLILAHHQTAQKSLESLPLRLQNNDHSFKGGTLRRRKAKYNLNRHHRKEHKKRQRKLKLSWSVATSVSTGYISFLQMTLLGKMESTMYIKIFKTSTVNYQM